MKRVLAGITAGMAAFVSLTYAAEAAWSVNGSGPAAAAAATMPTGISPTATLRSGTALVSWPAASLSNGTAVAGYIVRRYNAANHTASAVGGTCAGVVTSTSCTEQPPSGSWVYTDTPVQQSWTGGESPNSNSVVVP